MGNSPDGLSFLTSEYQQCRRNIHTVWQIQGWFHDPHCTGHHTHVCITAKSCAYVEAPEGPLPPWLLIGDTLLSTGINFISTAVLVEYLY